MRLRHKNFILNSSVACWLNDILCWIFIHSSYQISFTDDFLHYFPQIVPFKWTFRSAFSSLSLKFRLEVLANMGPGILSFTECFKYQHTILIVKPTLVDELIYAFYTSRIYIFIISFFYYYFKALYLPRRFWEKTHWPFFSLSWIFNIILN